MAADEALLESSVLGLTSLRFYGWNEATISLGYFQSYHVSREDSQRARLPCVRRPTGGLTLVHHHELTYALALPAGLPWQPRSAKPWLCRMHEMISLALESLGVSATTAPCTVPQPSASSLCFQHHTAGDLLLGASKVVGSAQRRQRGALLQHGAILLAASPYAPTLPGVRELTGTDIEVDELCAAIGREWVRNTGWNLIPSSWSESELAKIDELSREKYGKKEWTERR